MDDDFKRWKDSVLPAGPETMDKLFEMRDEPRFKEAMAAMLDVFGGGPALRHAPDGRVLLLRERPDAIRKVRDMLEAVGVEVPPWTEPPGATTE